MQSLSLTMARLPRRLLLQDNSYFHVTWKCHNDDHLLKSNEVKAFLYNLLLTFKEKHKIKIYGYCFLDNHPHIVGHCESIKEFSRFFQNVNGILARYINRISDRKGQVIMDRMKSPQIETERYLHTVLHYVDLNPVRAGVTKRAKDYRWSSYRAHAHGQPDPLLDPLPEGLRVTTQTYQKISSIILQKDSKKMPLYYTTFFIGTPTWVRKRRRTLFESMLQLRETRRLTQKVANA